MPPKDQALVRHAAHRARARADQSRRPGDSAGLAVLRALVDPRRRDDLGDAAAPRPRGGREGIPAVVRAAISSRTARCRAASIGAAPIRCRRTTATANSCSSSTRSTATPATSSCCARCGRRWSKRLRTWTSCACRSARRQNQQGERKAFYGLMPASISHEGYSAKPMHSYWDDFWALAGYEAAIRIARALEQKTQMHAFIESRDQFRSRSVSSRCSVAMQHARASTICRARRSSATSMRPRRRSRSRRSASSRCCRRTRCIATFERYWNEFVGAPHRHELGRLHAVRVAQPRHVHPPALARPRHGADRVLHERPAPARSGTSGRRSSGASRASRASSATCRTAGSPRTTAARCSTCSPTSGRPTRRWC